MLWSIRAAPPAPAVFSRRIFSAAAIADLDGRRAHLVDRLRLGARDLVLGLLRAPLQRVLQAGARLVREGLRLAARLLDDGLGLLADVAVLLLVVGQQLLGFLAQAAGLVELLADRLGAVVERLGDQPRHLVVEQDQHEHDEGDRDPELRHLRHRRCSYSAARWTSAFLHLVLARLRADQPGDDGAGHLAGDVVDAGQRLAPWSAAMRPRPRPASARSAPRPWPAPCRPRR